VRWDERAARPCAYTGAPDNGMWIPERGLGDTDGISVTPPLDAHAMSN